MKRLGFTIFLAIGCIFSFAQTHPIKDSIKLAFKEKPRVFVGFHNRNTFIRSYQTKLYGIIGGLDYDQKVKIYVGLYGFGGQNRTLLVNDPDFATDSVYRSLSTNNLSIALEYTYFNFKRLSLSMPIQAGFGGVYLDYIGDNKLLKHTNNVIIPIEIGSNAYLELLDWIGLKGGVGYRLSVGNSEVTKLSSPYYNLGLAILVGELYRNISK
jgi:hypothetical protein